MSSERKTRSTKRVNEDNFKQNLEAAEPEKKKQCYGQAPIIKNLSEIVKVSMLESDKTKPEAKLSCMHGEAGQACKEDYGACASKDLLPFIAHYKCFDVSKKEKFPSPDFLHFWGTAGWSLHGFSATMKVGGVMEKVDAENSSCQNLVKACKSLSSVNPDEMKIQHILRAMFSVESLWSKIPVEDYWKFLADLSTSQEVLDTGMDDFVLIVMCSAHAYFIREFDRKDLKDDHLNMYQWMHCTLPELICKGFKNCNDLYNSYIKWISKNFDIVDAKSIDMLGYIKVIVNYYCFSFLRYSDKFTREYMKTVAPKGMNVDIVDSACLVMRNVQCKI
ncbi:hypothetical protein GUITHDRAFT_119028 [Guillardia theta CCMP2712]|uniref:Uncharacterized protein n=1 Tax=Guillardia theta (strain CCMP2712) TaxID=905079 RepID=L1IF48_GUITC|nr:hypothetical protein GUITHDRAFT_119028 [Guillardia theta CCMP2712]EKX34843.1 hypothetical protein GUITHDRAFT_119028 [Guillardia theta CCMP2712]|eukprot:XP_005821823.1 hypothetical protein GUITHDRAFT_119028 [Guillardia theta CCMP2712]